MEKHEKIIDRIFLGIMVTTVSCFFGVVFLFEHGKIWGLVAFIVALTGYTTIFYGILILQEQVEQEQSVYCPDCQGAGKISEICSHCQGKGRIEKETQEIARTSG